MTRVFLSIQTLAVDDICRTPGRLNDAASLAIEVFMVIWHNLSTGFSYKKIWKSKAIGAKSIRLSIVLYFCCDGGASQYGVLPVSCSRLSSVVAGRMRILLSGGRSITLWIERCAMHRRQRAGRRGDAGSCSSSPFSLRFFENIKSRIVSSVRTYSLNCRIGQQLERACSWKTTAA